MRIITGIYKGRHFEIPRTFKARPTTDFAKENLFNVIRGYLDFDESTALDLFSGTGSISLELLSRGCERVVSVEKDRDHARFIQQCIEKIGAQNHVLIRAMCSALSRRVTSRLTWSLPIHPMRCQNCLPCPTW